MNKTAGYLQGNLEHHLDHLAPFCALQGWPLIVTDEKICELARLYYPDLTLYLWNPLQAPFLVTEHFDVIITTLPRISFDEIFFIAEATLGKRLKTLWLPHGNSDKGHLVPWMEALGNEEAAFVYGPKMVDFLREKRVHIPTVIPVGNFRYLYYQKHRSFYQKILDQRGLPSSFILYAPTWNDAENSGSFEAAIDTVLNEFSEVVIKPHPNQVEDIRVIQRQLSFQFHWLDHFPPIYPLLERTSHLIGDFSSIAYDFLLFHRPLFFWQSGRSDKGCFLHSYGTVISPSKPLKSQLENPHHPHEKIASLVSYTFGDPTTWQDLIEKVKQLDI